MVTFAKETLPVNLEEEMKKSYLEYAMSVIVGRALPDVRDGLKPVHRRVLFAMHELSNDYNKPYKKSARIVGDVIGKYHPHGDSAVYDAIVRMAQDFSLRYLLVDGQGNFGSVDGDNPAAMRYTEIRMTKITHELLADLDKETVNFGPNYDGSEHEPLVFPARFPNLLVNGSSGIAVGMATNIPPHNLGEVISACLALLENPEITIHDLIEKIPAPDFPTRGIIYGLASVREGYLTGRGKVLMRARTHFEEVDKSSTKQAIIVDELPYQVNKATLIIRIADLVRDKKIEGISDLRDESDQSGMRIVIELKKGEIPDVVLNHLYKLTQLQDTFGMNLVALVDNQPKLLNLKEMLQAFLSHRREVITRRTIYELRKARERAHLLEGLAVALSNVDEVIALIKASASRPVAREALMGRPWQSELVSEFLSRAMTESFRPEGLSSRFGLTASGYYLTEIQTNAILEMQLQRLTGLEQEKIRDEYRQVIGKIEDFLDILATPARVTTMIREELAYIHDNYSDARRSEIVAQTEELQHEDFVTPMEMVVTLSHAGYIKTQPASEYRTQNRGGVGRQAATTKEDDFIEKMFTANSRDHILCFSSLGRLYWLRVFHLPAGSRVARGRPINNLLPLGDSEKITAILPVKQFVADRFVMLSTARGNIIKIPLSEFSNPRSNGIIALTLKEQDQLVSVSMTDGQSQIMLFTSEGRVVRFSEHDVRTVGRGAQGVIGVRLPESSRVIAMLVADPETSQSVLTATANGFGKRTPLEEYTLHKRGGQGMISIQTSERNGAVIGACLVSEKDELMLITNSGVLIRTGVTQIREMGRNTQGVRLINVAESTELISITRIEETPEIESLPGEEVEPLPEGDIEQPVSEE